MKKKTMQVCRAIAFAAIFLSSVQADAQAYYKFLDNTAWYERYTNFGGPNYFWYYDAGDTVINSIDYKIIKDFPTYQAHYAREDTVSKKVYLVYSLGQPEYLLYDFSVTPGSSLIINWGGGGGGVNAVLDSIDLVLTPMGYRNRFNCSITGGLKVIYIEGVGSIRDPFFIINLLSDPDMQLICSYVGTQQSYYYPPDTCPANIFTTINNNFYYENNFTISPVLASEFINITVPSIINNKNEITITDINGKKIFQTSGSNLQTKINITNFSKGIYFVELNNGKEKAVKKFIKI